jgi:hypothetical protein
MSDASGKIMSDFHKHSNYVNSIADLIRFKYKYDDDRTFRKILPFVEKNEVFFRKIQSTSVGDKKLALRNLRNAWYNEASFHEPTGYGKIKYTKFLPWKTVMFYYSIFTSLSAMVRCVYSDESFSGHNIMINVFTKQILSRKGLSINLYVPPFCFTLHPRGKITPSFDKVITWEHGLRIKCPIIEACLREVSRGGSTSIFHYFYNLRNWVNYEDSYIFRRLYGPSIRPGFYWDLSCILSAFMSLTEIFMIWVFGFDDIEKEKDMFINEFNQFFENDVDDELRVTRPLNNRFSYYDNYSSSKLA